MFPKANIPLDFIRVYPDPTPKSKLAMSRVPNAISKVGPPSSRQIFSILQIKLDLFVKNHNQGNIGTGHGLAACWVRFKTTNFRWANPTPYQEPIQWPLSPGSQ